MTAPLFSGVGVALVTLFRDDQRVDLEATALHAARLAALGVSAVVVAGTNGEAAALWPDERAQLIAAVRAAVPSAVPVIAGTGSASAYQAVQLSRAAADNGADAVLALSPPKVADCRDYYARVRAAVEIPVLAYHFPAVSAPGIELDLLGALDVDGCKDSSGDPNRLLAELERAALPIYVGSSALLALAGPLGAAGAILGLANAEPELCAAAFTGDIDAQRRLAVAHGRADAAFPAGLKHLVAERFGTATTTRLG